MVKYSPLILEVTINEIRYIIKLKVENRSID